MHEFTTQSGELVAIDLKETVAIERKKDGITRIRLTSGDWYDLNIQFYPLLEAINTAKGQA